MLMNTEQMGIFGYISVSIIKVGTKYWNNAHIYTYLLLETSKTANSLHSLSSSTSFAPHNLL